MKGFVQMPFPEVPQRDAQNPNVMKYSESNHSAIGTDSV